LTVAPLSVAGACHTPITGVLVDLLRTYKTKYRGILLAKSKEKKAADNFFLNDHGECCLVVVVLTYGV
jgi:hypothetical protein